MTSLANSKKGFKKLETLEMIELNGTGNLLDDSGSETELLDLTTSSKNFRRERNSCGSCCCWCGVLYAGLLTLFVMVVGVVSAYALTTSWQLSLSWNASHQPLQDEINHLKKMFKSNEKQTFYTLDGVSETMYIVNSSFTLMNVSIWRKLNDTVRRLASVEQKLSSTGREQQPQEFSDEELEVIKKQMMSLLAEVSVLNSSLIRVTQLMNYSNSLLGSLSSHMDSLSRTTGDTIKDNTNIQDSIQGFGDRIFKFEGRIAAMEKNVSTYNDRIEQTASSLDKNVTMLLSMMSALNSSLIEEVGQMWVNMTETQQILRKLQQEVSSLAGESIPDPINTTTAGGREDKVSPPISDEADTHTSAASNDVLTSTRTLAKEEETKTEEPSLATATATMTTAAATTASTDIINAERMPTHSDSGVEPSEETSVTVPSSGAVTPGEEPSVHQGGSTPSTTVNPDNNLKGSTGEGGSVLDQTVATTSATPEVNDDDDDDDAQSSGALELLKEIFDSFDDLLDLDGDEKLDFKEFSTLANSHTAFDAIDFNHDGFVDKHELKIALTMLENRKTASGQVTTTSSG